MTRWRILHNGWHGDTSNTTCWHRDTTCTTRWHSDTSCTTRWHGDTSCTTRWHGIVVMWTQKSMHNAQVGWRACSQSCMTRDETKGDSFKYAHRGNLTSQGPHPSTPPHSIIQTPMHIHVYVCTWNVRLIRSRTTWLIGLNPPENDRSRIKYFQNPNSRPEQISQHTDRAGSSALPGEVPRWPDSIFRRVFTILLEH